MKGVKKRCWMAVGSVILAAVALTAVTVPLSASWRGGGAVHTTGAGVASGVSPKASDAQLSGNSSILESGVGTAAGDLEALPLGLPACNGVAGLCNVPVRCGSR
jgi:hypothetical protein